MGRPSRAETAAARPVPADWTTSTLGQRFDHICRLRGWSLTQLAELSGHAAGVISRLASSKERVAGAVDTLGNVAIAAGVRTDWLMFGRGPIEERPGDGRLLHGIPEELTLRGRPNWNEVLFEAQERQRGIPDDIWEQAAEMALPPERTLDWQLLVGLVRELYWAQQRAQERPPGAA
jgi:transcriptional regulator with XRE-family HTH domain